MKNWNFQAPGISGLTVGVVYYIVNTVPCVTTRLLSSEILQVCEGARKDDPFCVVYLQDDFGSWYKGEYCYSNQRYKFNDVGLASVPDVILMMQMVAP
jgi:hypothetical protein